MFTVEFLWWVVGWGLHSQFRVQPNYSVEVVLCWGCDKIFNFSFSFQRYTNILFFRGLRLQIFAWGGKEKFGGKNPLFLKKLKIYCSDCNSIPKYLVLYYKRKEGNIQGSYKTN